MTLLQLVFILSGIVLLYVGMDVARKQKFNALHFVVFIGVALGLIAFTFFPSALTMLGRVFGLPRGADVLVYGSILFLMYVAMLLLSKAEEDREHITALVRAIALRDAVPSPASAEGLRFFAVVPAYNEAKVLATTLAGLACVPGCRIVLVDDGSRDDTLRIAQAFAQAHSGTVVLSHPRNRGQGAALETGFEWVRRHATGADYVATYDADGQHDPADLVKMAGFLDAHPDVDVVLGSRFLHGAAVGVPFRRRLLLKMGVLFTFLISRLKLTDAHNGLRMLRRRAMDRVRITQDGMAHASEVIDLVAEYGLTYAEMPVNIIYTSYSLAKGQRASNAVNIALKMIWRKISR